MSKYSDMQGTSSDFSNINYDTKTWSPQPIIPVEVFLCIAEAVHQTESQDKHSDTESIFAM